MKYLEKISNDFALLVSAITEKFAWIGTSGGGKSYAATEFAEVLWNAGGQFVVLDPVGIWYGLRLDKSGKKPSHINIPVFGGLHGDVPIDSTSGALIADLIIDKGICAIIDVSQFEHDTDKARFATAFAARFFFRKKAAPSAVHVFLEECQEFVPQVPQRGEERMLHEFTRMQKIGRNFGIGMSLITQRPQEVSKRVLNLSGTLFAFRTTGSHERKAIEVWMRDNRVDEESFLDTLPKLDTGAPHVWSPVFLKMSKVVRILPKKTFDASATPEIGAKSIVRHLAPIDLEKIKTDIAATIEKAKKEDPKFLQSEVTRLTSELAKRPENKGVDPAAHQRAVAVALAARDKEWAKVVKEWSDKLERVVSVSKRFLETLRKQLDSIGVVDFGDAPRMAPDVPVGKIEIPKTFTLQAPPLGGIATVNGVETPVRGRTIAVADIRDAEGVVLKAGARKMLGVLVSHSPMKMNKSQFATLSGMSPKSSTFEQYVAALKRAGLIYTEGGIYEASEAGMAAADGIKPEPQTPEDMRRVWIHNLKKGAAEMLDALITHGAMTLEELAAAVGKSPKSSTFEQYVAMLKRNAVAEMSDGKLQASRIFFY